MKKLLGLGFVILLLFLFSSSVIAQTSDLNPRIIIKFKASTTREMQEAVLKRVAALRAEKLLLARSFVIAARQERLERLVQELREDPAVEYAEPDYVAEAFETPNDPLFSQEWGLTKIQTPQAWDIATGGEVEIAVVDSGIDEGHPDLKGKVVSRANFTTEQDTDLNGHGTHVAGIAAASTNNQLGVAGTGYNTRLMSVKVLDRRGRGYYSWIANGVIWAADNGAEVINLSLGGSTSSPTLEEAINYASSKGVVVVAAAGNSGTRRPMYPAYYSSVITVAATDKYDRKASFSNYGDWVDVAAPGVSILSTYKGSYRSLSGTSMSSPFVAGVAGLVKAQHLDWSNGQVRTQIETTSDPIFHTGSFWTYGRINACRAVGGNCQFTSQ